MMYLVSYLLFTYASPIAIPTILFLVGLYISELNVVMGMYANILSFHHYHNFFYPDNIISRASMIHGMMDQRQPLQAWYEVQEALKHHPTDMRINLLASEICICMLDAQRAQYHLNVAIQNVYDGQLQSQQPCFIDIQNRINNIINQETKNKYSPRVATPPNPKRALQHA